MARMYPETILHEANRDNPEYQVFQMLRELPDHFSVIYSKKFKGGRNCKEETEIDFLIFDGVKNLICLEVKGGEIAYNGAESCWYQNGTPMKRSPDRQASAACHAVIDYLGKDAANLNINWALAFPNCSRPAGSGRIAEVPEDLILDSQTLLDPVAGVSRVCHYNETHLGREGVNKYQASLILERLLRSVGFITKIGVRLLHDAKQLVQATEQQLEILDDLELNRKTAVMGYAGTGKTIIATEFAKRQSEKGRKVLLLFYNRMVANTVRYGLGRDSTIECTTFHSLARHEIEAVDSDWWQSQKGTRDSEFWETEVPLKMLEVLDGKAPRFDTIIIDEGQDFRADWIETLGHMQIPGPEPRFVVLYDAKQDIFGRWSDLPWEVGTFTRRQLRKNCRNTKSIVSHLKQLVPSDMVAFDQSPEGLPVAIHVSSSEHEQEAAIRETLQQLIREGVYPGGIVILIDGSLAESSLAGVEKIGRYQLEWMGRSYRSDNNKLQICSIDSFKGLEADVIFDVSSIAPNETACAERNYTAASRAKLALHVFKLQFNH